MGDDRRACLDENEIAALFAGELRRDELDTIDQHAAECAVCHAQIVAYAGAFAESGSLQRVSVSSDDAVPVIALAHLRAQQRVGSTLAGKWKLEALLGVGGTAQVFAATHRNGARVAIKILRPEIALAGGKTRRFLREGYIANRVRHSGAVRVLDDDVDEDGTAFLVMDLFDGVTLRQRIDDGGPVSVDEVVRIADQVLDVLAAAHDEGIVHRDIKPENVLLTADKSVKVLDFGIARLREMTRDEGATESGIKIGTPAYMPPEQARGESSRVSPASDVWSVGATMFFALTGRVPKPAKNLEHGLFLAMTEPVVPIRSVRPDLPLPLATLVDRALAFEPADRFPNSRAMQTALRACASETTDPKAKRDRRRTLLAFVMVTLSIPMAIFLARLSPARNPSPNPTTAPRTPVDADLGSTALEHVSPADASTSSTLAAHETAPSVGPVATGFAAPSRSTRRTVVAAPQIALSQPPISVSGGRSVMPDASAPPAVTSRDLLERRN